MNALQAMSEAFDGMTSLMKRVQAENVRLAQENFVLRCQAHGKVLVPADVLKRAVETLRDDAEEALLDSRPNTAKKRECLADELATFLPKE